ncbi:uncharacterized protein LOC123697471 [Colias croceus]|uniref:uncharacterized protein LOC123697471 n=1 Tax=Colias crocea TaxID=72248 RepID=UPI001E27C3E1|nr:uncharacterized protein LOC123697471 [Colias croceus]
MESKKQSFYKRYAARLKDEQEPVAGTSNTPLMETVSKPAVVKRLIFKTPKKETQKYKSKNLNKKLLISKPVVMRSENTEAESPSIDLTVCDLTDDIREPYQEQNLTEKVIQKELDIFREIERQHEIEEACEQIRREHFEEMNTGSKFVQIESKQLELTDSKIIMEDYNTETPEIVPDSILKRCDSKQFFETEESKGEIVKFTNENIESENDATDGILLCLRNNMEHNNDIDFKYMKDFKEIDINLQENEKVSAEINFTNIGMNIQEDQKSYEGEICNDKKIPEINESVQNESHISKNVNLGSKISGDEKEEIRTDNDKGNQEKHENVTKNDRDDYIKIKRLRQQTREKYVDFLSDNEDFANQRRQPSSSPSQCQTNNLRKIIY